MSFFGKNFFALCLNRHDAKLGSCNWCLLLDELQLNLNRVQVLREKKLKNKIHQILLAVLGNEDDYVDVSTLMSKITNYH